MNKTLLLILCDFLLLNLLALTRWDKPPDALPDTSQTTPAETAQKIVQEDLVAELRVTLDSEREARNALREQLQTTQSTLQQQEETLQQREQRLAALNADLAQKEKEAQQLNARVADTQSTVVQLSDRLARTAEQAASSRTQAEQLAKELAERQAAAAKLAEEVAALQNDKTQAQQQIQSLSTQVQVAETTRTMLERNVQTLETQVQAERVERERLQQNTATLAEGVTQLADRTADVRDTIKANTPINANTLYNDFLANRVNATFRSARDIPLLGPTTRPQEAKTIFVSDGTGIYAVFHASETPASLRDGAADWREITGTLSAGSRQIPVPKLQFLHIDPRIVVLPVDQATPTAFGARVYPVAKEPFKFAEAVLMSDGGDYYGEVEFRLDQSTPGYVKMDRPVLGRMFGKFAPSAGDIVFSKTGEVLGVMANNSYCVLVGNFGVAAELPFGTNLLDRKVSNVLSAQKERVTRLPLQLQ